MIDIGAGLNAAVAGPWFPTSSRLPLIRRGGIGLGYGRQDRLHERARDGAMATRRRESLRLAQSEAAELVAEIRRLRPAWILDQPDLDAITGHERFWLRTIYDLALADAPQLLSLNQVVGTRERREICNLQEAQQVRFRSDGFFRSIEEAQRSSRPSQSLRDLRARGRQEAPRLPVGIRVPR